MAVCVNNMSIQSKFHSYGMFVIIKSYITKRVFCLILNMSTYIYEICYDGEVIVSTQ